MSPTDAERDRRWRTPSPGPWEWTHESVRGNEWESLYDPGGIPVIETHTHGVTDGNARLIAAAPDLLTALEAYVKDNDGYCYRCERENDHASFCPIPQARAAIAKARGSPDPASLPVTEKG